MGIPRKAYSLENIEKLKVEISALEKEIKDKKTVRQKFSHYRSSAKRRGFNFLLTMPEFGKLVSDRCFYCASEPLNGVDRIDSLVGYDVKNCVACCSICNRGKSNMSIKSFMIYINRLSLKTTKDS